MSFSLYLLLNKINNFIYNFNKVNEYITDHIVIKSYYDQQVSDKLSGQQWQEI